MRCFVDSGLVVVFLASSGCAAIQLRPGAERIIVTRAFAPVGCKFLGGVVGSQGDFVSGPLTSNRNLAEGASNDLKNRALELGGNYVVLETNQAGNTMSGNAGSLNSQQTDVTNTGNVFACPPELVGL